MRRLVGSVLRSYTITLLVVGIALLSVSSVLAAEAAAPASSSDDIRSFIGGVIASTIINLIAQLHFRRVANRAQKTEAKVDTLSRELGVDDPQKATPDIMKMQSQVEKLDIDLSTVKDELVNTLQERDTARTLLNAQMEKNTQDSVNAQTQIDQLTRDRDDERQVSARLESQLRDYDQRFHEQELKMARIEGRLDQQAIQDNLSHAMQGFVSALEKVAERLAGQPQPEGTPT